MTNYKELALNVAHVLAEQLEVAKRDDGEPKFVVYINTNMPYCVSVCEAGTGQPVFDFIGDTWNETYWQVQHVVEVLRFIGIRR